MRIPLAVNLESRDGTLDQDALIKNGIIERRGDSLRAKKRPGLTSHIAPPTAGSGQALHGGMNLLSVVGDKICWLSSRYDNYLDPANKHANITLSNGNMTATSTGAGGVAGKLNVIEGGVIYIEVTIGSSSGTERVGLAFNAAIAAGGAPGTYTTAGASATDAYDIAYSVDGYIYAFNTQATNTTVTATSGDVIGMAVYNDRATAGAVEVKWFKNGTLVHTEATNGTNARGIGTPFLAIGASATGGVMTVNFGASPFSYTIPTALECAISPTTASASRWWIAETSLAASTRRYVMHNGMDEYYTVAYPSFGSGAFTSITNVTGPFAGGIAYLDGYFFIMDANGKIMNSASENPSSFAATDYLYANAYPGSGRYIGRSLQYIVALKEWSTEWFYNAGNPTGSVLTAVQGSARQIGCLDALSVANVADSIFWIGQETSGKLGLYRLRGVEIAKVSTQAVDAILELSTLASNRGYGTTVDGRGYYVLKIGDLGIAIAYDEATDTFVQWSTLTAGSNKSVSSITRSGTTATVNTSTAHGMSDGDAVTIAGANQSEYNGLFQISYTDTDTFTIEVSGSPASPATGTITATPYSEGVFDPVSGASFAGRHLVLASATSEVYEVSPSTYKDDGIPINFFARTIRLDGGNQDRKKLQRVGVVGDSVSDTAMLRWSDNDSSSFTKYRRVTLSSDSPELRRCGGFERRSIEFRHIGNTAPAIDALELELGR